MKTFRIVFGILAAMPLTLLVDSICLHPNNYGQGSLGELAYLVFGVPIVIFNFWAWSYPEVIAFYFFGKEKSGIRASASTLIYQDVTEKLFPYHIKP